MPYTGGGLEAWCQAGGHEFTRWDLWYLVVLLCDFDGSWDDLRASLKPQWSWQPAELWEGKRYHLIDLRRRLGEAGLDPVDLVGDLAQDKRILRKARTKVLEKELRDADKTAAMRETPRRVLAAQALRGQWDLFPVSPAAYERLFSGEIGRPRYEQRDASFALSRRLKAVLKKADHASGSVAAARLALYRATLTALIAAMGTVDDSYGVVGDLFGEVLSEYFTIPWQATGIGPEVYYRDFLNFAVWEDFGLTYHRLDPFFGAVAPEHIVLVDAVLRDIRTELLLYEELVHQADEALTLLGELYVVKRNFGRFTALAHEMGSRQWERVTRMAEAAVASGRRHLALEIFTAADQPGWHQAHLRELQAKLTGLPPL